MKFKWMILILAMISLISTSAEARHGRHHHSHHTVKHHTNHHTIHHRVHDPVNGDFMLIGKKYTLEEYNALARYRSTHHRRHHYHSRHRSHNVVVPHRQQDGWTTQLRPVAYPNVSGSTILDAVGRYTASSDRSCSDAQLF